MNPINVGQLKVWPSTYSFGFQLTVWTNTAGLTIQLCRIYNNTIRFLAHTNTAASLISSVGFVFNISAWTDTTATSQISPEGFLSIFQLELTQQQPHKSALKDFDNDNKVKLNPERQWWFNSTAALADNRQSRSSWHRDFHWLKQKGKNNNKISTKYNTTNQTLRSSLT